MMVPELLISPTVALRFDLRLNSRVKRVMIASLIFLTLPAVAFSQSVKSAQTAAFIMPADSGTTAATAAASASSTNTQLLTRTTNSPAQLQPLQNSGEVTVAQPLTLDPSPVNQVSGHTVACQAATCWQLAKLLEQRARTILTESQDWHGRPTTSATVQANYLRHLAIWQRDFAAALALRGYYTWIANQQQLQLVEEGFALQREQAQVQASLIAKGMAITDPTALDRKRLELLDNQVQLTAAQRQLSSSLLRLTCCHTDLAQCATEGLEIQAQPTECSALVTYALAHRHDYLGLVGLHQCLDEETALAVAKLLSPFIGLGIDMLDLNLIERICLKHRGDELLAQVRRELKMASDILRSRIEQSVCEKCQALDVNYQRVAIAEEVVRSWETRIAALKRLEELGDARGESQATAQAEWITARATLVSRKLAAKLAEVDLAEAVGELSIRSCQGEAWLVR